jgi:hypothetical protein
MVVFSSPRLVEDATGEMVQLARQAVNEGHRDVESHRDARQPGQSDAISSAHCEANAMFWAVRLNDLLASVVIC